MMSKTAWNDLSDLNEHDLRTQILVPLLNRTPGVTQVTDVHGVNERGLDVVFFTADSIRRTCYGIQAKTGNIAGGGSGDKTVKKTIDQLELAEGFKHSVALPPAGEYFIDHFIVATNGRISATAREEIARRAQPIPVSFWDVNAISERIRDVCPELLSAVDVETVEYLSELKARCETLDALDQVTGVESRILSEVFVEPSVRRRFDPTLANNTATDARSTAFGALALADLDEDFVILGDQNDGKTAILRMIAIQGVDGLLSGNTPDDGDRRIPVLFRASQITSTGSVQETAASMLEKGGAKTRARELRKDGDLGPYLLMIDGFSELQEEKQKHVCAGLIEALGRRERARIIVTGRLDDFLRPGFFDGFRQYHIEEFSQRQVRSLVQKWTHDSVEFRDVAEMMIDRVKDALQLPGSPIPAIIGVLLYEKEKKFITNTAEAVNRYMVIRLGRYAEELGIRTEVDWARKQDLLAEVAFQMVREGLDSIPETDALDIMEKTYNRLGEPSKSPAAVRELIDAGVLDRKDGDLSFFRTGFRDFFAAHHIVNSPDTLDEFFRQHVFDRRWGPVLVFAAGLRRHNSGLLRNLVKIVGQEGEQLSVAGSEDYLYGAFLLGRVLSNSEASERDARMTALRTCLGASEEAVVELAKEAQQQFGNFGQVIALVGTEHTFLATVGVPWLQEQFRQLGQEENLSEEQRYLVTSVYTHLGCDDWLGVLESATKEARRPRVLVALLILIYQLDVDRELDAAEKHQWEGIKRILDRKRKRLSKSVDEVMKLKSPLLELERKRLKRLQKKYT